MGVWRYRWASGRLYESPPRALAGAPALAPPPADLPREASGPTLPGMGVWRYRWAFGRLYQYPARALEGDLEGLPRVQARHLDTPLDRYAPEDGTVGA